MMLENQTLKEAVRLLFKNDKGEPLELYSYQVKIVRRIFFKYPKRVVCTAATRAGKSLAVAIGVILLAMFRSGERIRLIAPTEEHTKIVMGYVIDHIFDNEIFTSMLMIDTRGQGAERLKKALSKQKIRIRNDTEIMTITANISSQGRSAIGWGGSMVIVDEGEQIPTQIMVTKIMRMLGDSPDSAIFMIGNPVKYGFMYDKSTNPKWAYNRIDWRVCVKEGRMTQEFVDEQRDAMNENEFKIWYEAQWPDEVENQLFPLKALKKMFAPLTQFELDLLKTEPSEKHLGIDVARFGNDLTVLQPRWTYGDIHFLMPPKSFGKKNTMFTVGETLNMDKSEEFEFINVDDPGVGGGVVDRLKEVNQTMGRAVSFVAGESPHKHDWALNKREEENNKRYLNKKSYWFNNFARLAEKGNVRVVPSQYSQVLHSQLQQLFYEYTSNGHMKVFEESDKSPDFADSANISLFLLKPRAIFTTT